MRTAPPGAMLSFLSQPLGICDCAHVGPPEPHWTGAQFIPESQSLSSDISPSLQTFLLSTLASFTFLHAFLYEANSGKKRAFD